MQTIIRYGAMCLVSAAVATNAVACLNVNDVVPDMASVAISINGKNFDTGLLSQHKRFAIYAVDKQPTDFTYDFANKQGKKYLLHVNYKKLPSNRSFPTNLDITLTDKKGRKLGYLFFAINGVHFLKRMGEFGLVVNDGGDLIDVNFQVTPPKTGGLHIDSLTNERFVQDTLLPSKNFQMIRPVLLNKVDGKKLSKTFSLDNHPFAVNYTLKQLPKQNVMFEHNLYATEKGKPELLERIYYRAGDMNTLREGMFAGKYFHPSYGAFKLVFYPAMGQTEPKQVGEL